MAALCKLTSNFIATEVDEEILIVGLDGGELFSLSGTGRAIWEAIDGTRDEAAIVALMAEQFAGDPAAIAADVAAMARQLADAALVGPAA